jgi:hypothetical protein
MPKAFSLTYGLDLETEVASFWAWLHDADEVMRGTGEGSKQVRDLIESQREEIDNFASKAAAPESARFALTLAIASVGFHYASHQKLLHGLDDYGLLQPAEQRRRPAFDTIVEPPLGGAEPPH